MRGPFAPLSARHGGGAARAGAGRAPRPGWRISSLHPLPAPHSTGLSFWRAPLKPTEAKEEGGGGRFERWRLTALNRTCFGEPPTSKLFDSAPQLPRSASELPQGCLAAAPQLRRAFAARLCQERWRHHLRLPRPVWRAGSARSLSSLSAWALDQSSSRSNLQNPRCMRGSAGHFSASSGGWTRPRRQSRKKSGKPHDWQHCAPRLPDRWGSHLNVAAE